MSQDRIVISIQCTLDWLDLSDITINNAEEYCRLRRYGIVPEIFGIHYCGYEKIKSILKIFDSGANVVWSMDADTLITNHNKRVEDYIDHKHDFFICKDYNGINAGSFIVRKTKWAISFLEWLLKCKGKDKMYCEQDAINLYMKLFPATVWKQIYILPHPSINSYLYENYPDIPMQKHEDGQWEAGDFVLHLPGMGMEKRIEIMKNTKIVK